MNPMKKFISVICVIAMLVATVSLVPVGAATYDTPVDADMWIEPNFETDVAYSFAFVGDTQYLTCGDYYLGTNTMDRLYSSIASTAAERKLSHVFILGDITDLGYRNDYNQGGAHNSPIITGEWDIAQKAIFKLNGIVPYSITRGNHDDYMIDDYFNVAAYTNQFKTNATYTNSAYTGTYQNGGFYSDPGTDGKGPCYPNNKQGAINEGNTEGRIYWSAKTKTSHTSTMVNSWKTLNIAGVNYLLMSVDYNPTKNVFDWVDGKLAEYPDHKAIIITHSYLTGTGELATSEQGNTVWPMGFTADRLWDEVLSKHENVFMVVSGHTGGIAPTYSYNKGVNGNEVLQVLVDPQAYDAKEINTAGTIEHGTQDTGMVLYMNFSKDGKRINFDYYSTLLNKFLKRTDHTIYIEPDESVNDKEVNMTDLAEYGQVNSYLKSSVKATATLNGAIGANEYSFTRTTAANSTNQFESDLVEYFAHDDEYLYYGLTFKQTNAGQSMQINLKPNYDWINKSEVTNESHWSRYKINYKIAEDGTVTKLAPESMITDGWATVFGDISANMSYCRWDKDIFVSSSRDSSTKVNTVEFKIRKAYLADNTPEKELQNFAYILYLGTNASGNQMWHRFVNSAASSASVGTGRWLYENLLFIDTDAPLTMKETASARLSSTYSGLRFKAEISTADLNYYKNNYESVQAGILIAPKDLVGDKILNHNYGVAGKDYIDVISNVNNPYDEVDGTTVFAGSIVNIKQGNLARDFVAVGYLKVVDSKGVETYYYTENYAQRNVSDVATAAYFDIKTAAETGYTNLVARENDAMKGYYSPYTDDQRRILAALIVNTDDKDPTTPDIF